MPACACVLPRMRYCIGVCEWVDEWVDGWNKSGRVGWLLMGYV